MSNNLVPFVFEDHQVRAVSHDGEPWFVAADVCQVLGIENPTKAVASLDEDEKMTLTISGSHSGQRGGPRLLIIISESGFYTVALRSRKAVTPGTTQHRFRKWITGAVIPAIRKTGGYQAPEATTQIADRPRMAKEQTKRGHRETITLYLTQVEMMEALEWTERTLLNARADLYNEALRKQEDSAKNDVARALVRWTRLSNEEIGEEAGLHPAYVEYLRQTMA